VRAVNRPAPTFAPPDPAPSLGEQIAVSAGVSLALWLVWRALRPVPSVDAVALLQPAGQRGSFGGL
jgi:hypothetical protein